MATAEKLPFSWLAVESLPDLDRLRLVPESGKVSLKVQLRAEVAHIKASRPDIKIVAIADGAPDNWTFLKSLSPMDEVVDFRHACAHLAVASDHAVALRSSSCSEAVNASSGIHQAIFRPA